VAVPPDPILRAARRWLERIPVAGLARTRALLTALPQYSDVTPTQYETALQWLGEAGLLESFTGGSVVEHIFEAALQEAGWFRDADLLVRGPDELPRDALRAAEVLDINPEEGYQHLTKLWGRVDTENRERIGAAGEEALVRLLRGALNASVDHVSNENDGLGYDVAVSGGGKRLHLEVKSTTRHTRRTFYLSRNEYEVSLRDSSWRLVMLSLDEGLRIVSIETVDTSWIHSVAPRDASIEARWSSARLEAHSGTSRPGIVGISDFVNARAQSIPLLVGA
jgi:hypothetical protein